MSPHRHTKACQRPDGKPCTREWDLETGEVTDALRLRTIQRTARSEGRRLRDEPPWWSKIVLKAGLRGIELAGYALGGVIGIGLLALSQHCGVKLPGVTP